MNIQYTARHAEITDQTRKYCSRRIQGLEKMLGYPVDADIILSTEKYRHKVEIKIKIKGATINTVEETSDTFSSLVAAFDHVEKRIKKDRQKLREKKRRTIRDLEVGPPQTPEDEEQEKRVIRSKNFSMKPMSIEEAVIQLDSNRREVLVFRSVDTDKWAVLYRRKDGHYGLVEPE